MCGGWFIKISLCVVCGNEGLPPARGARYGTRIVWRVRASSNSCDSILVLVGVVGFNMMRKRVLSRESLFTVGALVGHQGVR